MNQETQDLDLLLESDLFDPNWYAETYPDVNDVGIPPAEHYLRYGTLLLRDPGPRFCTRDYIEGNPDVADANLNALVHYLRFGREEGRQIHPSAERMVNPCRGALESLAHAALKGWAVDSTKPGDPVELSVFVNGQHLTDFWTSQRREDLASAGMNGDVAGFAIPLRAGLFDEGTEIDVRFKAMDVPLEGSPRQVQEAPVGSSSVAHLLESHRAGAMLPVTVIVPVFNAYDAVCECLASLRENLPENADVLMVDDCSTDPRIGALLADYASGPGFRLHRNDTNLGYTRSVNRAISLASGRDVVLLNSDTVVTARWIHNLRYCAYSAGRVATVTPLSDNAGAFSVPKANCANNVPPGLTAGHFARAAAQAGAGRPLEVPTGNGFCMYIRRSAIESLGVFDEVAFPRGYGEENDYCMRALRRGWKNLVCDKTLVFHKRSQSFGQEREDLTESGVSRVHHDYPEYRLLVQRFNDVEFCVVRRRVENALHRAAKVLPLRRLLFVISTETGGTPQTNLDLMRGLRGRFDCFLLRCDSQVMTLSRLEGGNLNQLEVHELSGVVEPVSHRSDHYDQILLGILYRHSIELLHVRHVAWHGLGLADCAKALGIPMVFSIHDFYSLCPSLNLLDEELRHCGGKCTPSAGRCRPHLWPDSSLPDLKHRFVVRWREMFRGFLQSCDQLVTTTASAVKVFSCAYPEMASKLTVIPHGRDFSSWCELAGRSSPGERVRILVPGNISASKGAALIRAVAEADKGKRLEFHFLGGTSAELAGIGVHHGHYSRDEFAQRVAAITPHLGVVLSIWPETYCHTLTEMWSCGIPVLGLDIGAVGERIREVGAGWLVDPATSAPDLLDALIQAADDSDGYQMRVDAVLRWQKGEGAENSTAKMCAEYHRLYESLLKPPRLHKPASWNPGRDVVVFWKQNDSTLYGRRHDMVVKYLASRSDTRRILVFDYPISMATLARYSAQTDARSQDKFIYVRTHAKLSRRMDGEKIRYRVFAYQPGVCTSGNDALTDPEISLADAYIEYIRETLRAEGVDPENSVFWYYPKNAFIPRISEELKPFRTVVDVVDDHRAWPNVTPEQRQVITAHYRDVLSLADFAFANCESVRASMSEFLPGIRLVPNGCDVDMQLVDPIDSGDFDRVRSWRPRKVIGFVGNLETKIDTELLVQVAQEFPDCLLVLIGSTHTNPEVVALASFPNVLMPGVVPYENVGAWIRSFDVAIIPHRTTELTRCMNPMKLFVYATHRVPIVSTDVPNLDAGVGNLMIATTHQEFLDRIRDVLSGSGRFEASSEYASRNSWEARFKSHLDIILRNE